VSQEIPDDNGPEQGRGIQRPGRAVNRHPEWCRPPVAPSRSSQGGREGERRTHEQRAGVRVTAVVRAVWIRVRLEQPRHHHRRYDDADERDPQRPEPTARPEAQDEDKRPKEVELLLDRKRPQVLKQRGPAQLLEVRPVPDDLRPVRAVGQRSGDITPEPSQFVRRDCGRDDDDRGEHRDQGRKQPPRAPHVEAADAHPAVGHPLDSQQRRDQESGEDEEHIDAEETSGQPAGVEVVDEHGGDRQRS
jgi:hypothetical protein